MSIESLGQAQRIMKALQSDKLFEHVGMDSRGIRVQTKSLIRGIATFSVLNPDLEAPTILIAGLISAASEDYGTFVGIKGTAALFICIRGLEGPLSDDMSSEDLSRVILRRSGVGIYLNMDGKSQIWANSIYLTTKSGQETADAINQELKKLTEVQKERLTTGLVEVLTQEVSQSGEFFNLV